MASDVTNRNQQLTLWHLHTPEWEPLLDYLGDLKIAPFYYVNKCLIPELSDWQKKVIIKTKHFAKTPKCQDDFLLLRFLRKINFAALKTWIHTKIFCILLWFDGISSATKIKEFYSYTCKVDFYDFKVKQFEDCKIYVSPILSSVKSFYCKMISRNILQLIHNLSFFHSVW